MFISVGAYLDLILFFKYFYNNQGENKHFWQKQFFKLRFFKFFCMCKEKGCVKVKKKKKR